MSAREELISLLCTTMDNKDATAVVDAYAHELAEELREFIGPEQREGKPEYSRRFVLGWRMAADEIDPEPSDD